MGMIVWIIIIAAIVMNSNKKNKGRKKNQKDMLNKLFGENNAEMDSFLGAFGLEKNKNNQSSNGLNVFKLNTDENGFDEEYEFDDTLDENDPYADAGQFAKNNQSMTYSQFNQSDNVEKTPSTSTAGFAMDEREEDHDCYGESWSDSLDQYDGKLKTIAGMHGQTRKGSGEFGQAIGKLPANSLLNRSSSVFENKQSTFENKHSTFENKHSTFENKQSTIKTRESLIPRYRESLIPRYDVTDFPSYSEEHNPQKAREDEAYNINKNTDIGINIDKNELRKVVIYSELLSRSRSFRK